MITKLYNYLKEKDKEIVFGLVFGLFFGLVFGLVYGLVGGLVFGLVFHIWSEDEERCNKPEKDKLRGQEK